MARAFYNRTKELNELRKKYDQLESSELCVIYGRRRLGKTVFIKKFLEDIKEDTVYNFVNNTNKKELLEILSDNIFDQTGERINFKRWEDFFKYLANKSKKNKFVFVMDEFPRLQNISKSFVTKFQDHWDSYLKDQKLMFIAIGSSMSMMHKIFMNKKAPLYGRISYNLFLKPFNYFNFRKMFKELDENKKVKLYSIFGGTPHFLWYVKKYQDKKLLEIISKTTLADVAPLKEEPINFITMELKKETNYNSILHSISRSNGTRKEIIDKSGISQKNIDYYLNNLKDLLSIIEEYKPLFYNKKNKKRYKFTDNFFDFWYNYIFANQSLIELNNKKYLIKKIKEDINIYIGQKFEEIVKELLILYNGDRIKSKNINFNEISPWWGKNTEGNNEEIDIILNNTYSEEVIACEVKWKNKKASIKTVKELDRKAKLMKTNKKISYLIVSKTGFTKECLEYMNKKNITYLNLEELSYYFENKTK